MRLLMNNDDDDDDDMMWYDNGEKCEKSLNVTTNDPTIKDQRLSDDHVQWPAYWLSDDHVQ